MTAATVPDEPRRCRGTTQAGAPCGVGPELVLPSGFCFTHDASRRSEHKAGATLGGIKSNLTKRRGLDPDALGKLETPEDAMRISARLTIAAATGELAAPQVNAALSAVKQWLAAFEADVLDKRLAAWEAANPEQARR